MKVKLPKNHEGKYKILVQTQNDTETLNEEDITHVFFIDYLGNKIEDDYVTIDTKELLENLISIKDSCNQYSHINKSYKIEMVDIYNNFYNEYNIDHVDIQLCTFIPEDGIYYNVILRIFRETIEIKIDDGCKYIYNKYIEDCYSFFDYNIFKAIMNFRENAVYKKDKYIKVHPNQRKQFDSIYSIVKGFEGYLEIVNSNYWCGQVYNCTFKIREEYLH